MKISFQSLPGYVYTCRRLNYLKEHFQDLTVYDPLYSIFEVATGSSRSGLQLDYLRFVFWINLLLHEARSFSTDGKHYHFLY